MHRIDKKLMETFHKIITFLSAKTGLCFKAKSPLKLDLHAIFQCRELAKLKTDETFLWLALNILVPGGAGRRGGGRLRLGILRGGVPAGSPNPDYIQTKECNFPNPFSGQTSKIRTRFLTWPKGRCICYYNFG